MQPTAVHNDDAGGGTQVTVVMTYDDDEIRTHNDTYRIRFAEMVTMNTHTVIVTAPPPPNRDEDTPIHT